MIRKMYRGRASSKASYQLGVSVGTLGLAICTSAGARLQDEADSQAGQGSSTRFQRTVSECLPLVAGGWSWMP